MRFKRTIAILSTSLLTSSISMPAFAQGYDSYSRHENRSWSYAENNSYSNPAALADGSGFWMKIQTLRAGIEATRISFEIRA